MWEWFRTCCPWCIAPKDDDAWKFDGRLRYPSYVQKHPGDKRLQSNRTRDRKRRSDVPSEGYFKAKYGRSLSNTTVMGIVPPLSTAFVTKIPNTRLPRNSRELSSHKYRVRDPSFSASTRSCSLSSIPRPKKILSKLKERQHNINHWNLTDTESEFY